MQRHADCDFVAPSESRSLQGELRRQRAPNKWRPAGRIFEFELWSGSQDSFQRVFRDRDRRHMEWNLKVEPSKAPSKAAWEVGGRQSTRR